MACLVCSELESDSSPLFKACANDECDLQIHKKCLILRFKNDGNTRCNCGSELSIDQFKKFDLSRCLVTSLIFYYKIFICLLTLIFPPFLEIGYDMNAGGKTIVWVFNYTYVCHCDNGFFCVYKWKAIMNSNMFIFSLIPVGVATIIMIFHFLVGSLT